MTEGQEIGTTTPDSPGVLSIAKTGPWKGLHSGMALAAKGMVLVFVILSVAFLDAAGALYSDVRAWIEGTLDWYYVLTVCVAVFVSLYLMCSRYGNIRLGDDDARPEFSTFSWLAMLFSAGLGIGLLFFSIAEPLYYLDNSAPGGYPNNPHADRAGALLLDVQRAEHAVRVTYMHWGIHAWSVYVIVGLCLAWFGFRKKLPLTLRSALYPVIGERIYGTPGHLVDLLAVFGTVFGVATSLGLGVKQMGAGLDTLFGVDPGIVTQIGLIAAISTVATLSAVSGVGRGIRIISEWNIYLTVVLLGFSCSGPTEWLWGFRHPTPATTVAAIRGILTGGRRGTRPGRAADRLLLGWWISGALSGCSSPGFPGAKLRELSRRNVRNPRAGRALVAPGRQRHPSRTLRPKGGRTADMTWCAAAIWKRPCTAPLPR